MLPMQMVVGVGVAVTKGAALTVTTTVLVFEHPLASVPVAVYVVLIVGFTTSGAVLAPVFHRYVTAPDAVRVVAPPEQMLVDPLMEILGSAFTVRDRVAVLVHPAASVPVTV